MAGVSYGLVDFVTRGPIQDLPVREGATWAAQLNRPDALSCTINMRDPAALALDLRSSTEPGKTVLIARTDADVILAWGLISDDRVWDEDARTLSISAKGVWGSWLGAALVGPATMLTEPAVIDGIPNPALDLALSGLSLGSIGKRLVEERVAFPGAPDFVLPADEPGTREDYHEFTAMKRIGSALTDLTNRENGPDFAFEATRNADGLRLDYVMRHGSEATPGIGADVGVWGLGNGTPVSGLKVADNADDLASAAWVAGGRANDTVMLSLALNDSLVTLDGYPPTDYVDTARNSVVLQDTLDSYARQAASYASRAHRSLSFKVRGDASPALGQYRPGDYVTLGVPSNHPWLTEDIHVRLTSIDGDETGRVVGIGCDVIET